MWRCEAVTRRTLGRRLEGVVFLTKDDIIRFEILSEETFLPDVEVQDANEVGVAVFNVREDAEGGGTGKFGWRKKSKIKI